MDADDGATEGGSVEIRDAAEADLQAVRSIYNAVITDSLAVWSEQPVDSAERQRWFDVKRDGGEPVLVAESEGEVVGFATFGRFRNHSGYDGTVEHTVHVRADARDAGIGGRLLAAVIERAEAVGKHTIVAGVGAQNEGSLRFHARHGFREVGRMPGIGHKFDRRLDLVLLQRDLDTSSS